MRKRTSDYSSDTEPRLANGNVDDDITILRRTEPAFTSFLEAKNILDGSGEEIRRLLLQECNLIFECNVCRNMFRDLPNFITHKRFYCCATLAAITAGAATSSSSSLNPSVSAVLQLYPASASPSQNTNDGLVAPGTLEEEKTTATKAAGNVLGVENFRAAAVMTGGSTTDDNGNKNNPSLMPANHELGDLSVYNMLVQKKREQVNVKGVVDENRPLGQEPNVDDREATVDGNKNRLPAGESNQNSNKHASKMPQVLVSKNFQCRLCDVSFQSSKALKIHFHRKHMSAQQPSSTLCSLKCPSCPLTFMRPVDVIRHLATDHRSSVRRFRVKQQGSNASENDDTIPKETANNRELRLLQSNDGYTKDGHCPTNIDTVNSDATTLTITSNTTAKKKIMSNCIYCEKSFERRAALSTHLMSCRMKLEALEKPPPMKRARIQSNGSPSPDMDTHELNEDGNSSRIIKEENQESVNTMIAKLSQQMNELAAKENSQSDNSVDNTKIEKERIEDKSSSPPPLLEDSHIVISKIESESDTKDLSITKIESNGITGETQPKEINAVPCRCKICSKHFNALSNLRRHISMFHYRARKFGCMLCDYRAFRRYDIVNHLGFVHKMTEDRESMSFKYVSVHDVPYSKEDMDEDIVLEAGNTMTEALSSSSTSIAVRHDGVCRMRTYDKRPRRNKSSVNGSIVKKSPLSDGGDNNSIKATPVKDTSSELETTAGTIGDAEDSSPEILSLKTSLRTRQKLKRAVSMSSSFGGGGGGQHGSSRTLHQNQHQRRPIRNRIKPENKDFVYDMVGLLKENGDGSDVTMSLPPAPPPLPPPPPSSTDRIDTLRGVKRRSMVNETTPPSLPLIPFVTSANATKINGAMRRICLMFVQNGLAVSATLPELPAERPQMRPRTSTNRIDMQAVQVIDTNELEATRRRSKLLDDSFLDKISKKANASASEFKIKPCLEPHQSALASLLQKVDFTMQQQSQLQQQSQQTDHKPEQRQTELQKQLAQPPVQHFHQQQTPIKKEQQQRPPQSPQLMSAQSTLTGGEAGGIAMPVFAAATAPATYPPPLVRFDTASGMNNSHIDGVPISTTDDGSGHNACGGPPPQDHINTDQQYMASSATWSSSQPQQTPPISRNRITLVQRIAENRAAAAANVAPATVLNVASHQRDSLLRSALEN